MMVCGVLATVASSQYGNGRVSMMATVMDPPQAIEQVYGVEEMLATRDAEVGMQGGGRGRRVALALWRARCTLTACLARPGMVLGVLGLANAVAWRVWAGHGLLPRAPGRLVDMV